MRPRLKNGQGEGLLGVEKQTFAHSSFRRPKLSIANVRPTYSARISCWIRISLAVRVTPTMVADAAPLQSP